MSDQAELDRVIEIYLAGDYGRCDRELSELLRAKTQNRLREPQVVERARVYWATCILLAGERERAKEPLRAALSENPMMSPPDSLTFPPPVVSLFLEVRDEMQQLIQRREEEQVAALRAEAAQAKRRAEERRRRVEELERLASQETVVVRNSRWLAAVPFGVGQFQNDAPVLGWTFLLTETLLAGTALGAQIVMLDQYEKGLGQGAGERLDPNDLNANLDAAHTTLVVSSWAFLAVAAAGIAEAQINFVPERNQETRERSLPEHLKSHAEGEERAPAFRSPSWTPTVGPVSGGGMEFGIIGRF